MAPFSPSGCRQKLPLFENTPGGKFPFGADGPPFSHISFWGKRFFFTPRSWGNFIWGMFGSPKETTIKLKTTLPEGKRTPPGPRGGGIRPPKGWFPGKKFLKKPPGAPPRGPGVLWEPFIPRSKRGFYPPKNPIAPQTSWGSIVGEKPPSKRV